MKCDSAADSENLDPTLEDIKMMTEYLCSI